MDDLKRLFVLADAYAAHAGISESTLSFRVLRGGNRLRHIREGGDIGARRLREALIWFVQNWPADLAWPEGVARPSPSEGAPLGPRARGAAA